MESPQKKIFQNKDMSFYSSYNHKKSYICNNFEIPNLNNYLIFVSYYFPVYLIIGNNVR